MIISYHLNDIDIERQTKEILDIQKNENVQLKTNFKEYIKIYGTIFGIFSLILLLYSKSIYLFMIFVAIWFIAILILYFFQFYQIGYDHNQESLVIKKWYGNVIISKNNLKRVYIKRSYRAKSGTYLYINYLNDANKEKYILFGIFMLKHDAIRAFLDIFVI